MCNRCHDSIYRLPYCISIFLDSISLSRRVKKDAPDHHVIFLARLVCLELQDMLRKLRLNERMAKNNHKEHGESHPPAISMYASLGMSRL